MTLEDKIIWYDWLIEALGDFEEYYDAQDLWIDYDFGLITVFGLYVGLKSIVYDMVGI